MIFGVIFGFWNDIYWCMKPLFTPPEFKGAKSRDLLPLECYVCRSVFTIQKNEIQKSLKRQAEKNPRRNDLKYCSRKCSHEGKHNGKQIGCHLCGNVVYRTPRELKKTNYTFCSSSCSATYHNAHKTSGCRRSKLEKWIEKKLTEKYSSLRVDYNKTDAINAELDIYIPSLKLAFELNGIFHYEPIFGEDKLLSHKTNDERKFQACLEKHIELCIIDTSSQKRFTPCGSEKFLGIITAIIDRKWGTIRVLPSLRKFHKLEC